MSESYEVPLSYRGDRLQGNTLTTRRIGNLTRLNHTLAICDGHTIHYIISNAFNDRGSSNSNNNNNNTTNNNTILIQEGGGDNQRLLSRSKGGGDGSHAGSRWDSSQSGFCWEQHCRLALALLNQFVFSIGHRTRVWFSICLHRESDFFLPVPV